MAKATEQIPAEPFTRWLNERLGALAARALREGGNNFDRAQSSLIRELGWDVPSMSAGARKLYRFRHQLMSGSKNGKKGPRLAESFPRDTVEEALHHAGLRLGDLYPYEALVDEFAAEYAVPRDQAQQLADAWIERTWHTAFQDVGRFVLPEHRPRRYCPDCKVTTRVFAGVCEECMAPDKPRILKAVA